MALPVTDIECEVLDLTDVALADLRLIGGAHWERSVDRLVTQVSRPRPNFGGQGPPGRAD
jgi:hypothetical protein